MLISGPQFGAGPDTSNSVVVPSVDQLKALLQLKDPSVDEFINIVESARSSESNKTNKSKRSRRKSSSSSQSEASEKASNKNKKGHKVSQSAADFLVVDIEIT